VKVPEQWGDVVVPPGREHQTGGGVENLLVWWNVTVLYIYSNFFAYILFFTL